MSVTILTTYDDSIAYLERLVATPVLNTPGAGLERARFMLARLDNPQDRFITLHVTGSSGKGSTTAMAAAVLRAAGYRTGVFSSPHLVEYTERIAVDGEPIARDDWARLLNELLPLIEAMAGDAIAGYHLGRPALLQVLWPLAARYFVERGVEAAVVEAGMGGRFDSTSANNARVAVVTNVSLEHTQHLGHTTAEIAWHKSGVARAGGILVTAATDAAALDVIAAECAAVGATPWRVTCGAGAGEVRVSGDASSLRISTPLRSHEGLRIGLIGRHQLMNAACAAAAVDALEALGLARVPEAALAAGLASARVPGRLEVVSDDPVIVLDGAHNPDAARALATALRDLSGCNAPTPERAATGNTGGTAGPLAAFRRARPVLLLGILGDKDVAEMVAALAPPAQAIVVTEPPWSGRMGRAGEVAALSRRYCSDVVLEPEVPAALSRARRLAAELDAPLVVAGSLILVGAVRALLGV